jgi:hypothetical protein
MNEISEKSKLLDRGEVTATKVSASPIPAMNTKRAEIGSSAEIPNHPIAKLMYYLHCVKNCTDLNVSTKLTDYKNFDHLNDEELRDVVIYAHRYRPRVLRNLLFFEVDAQNYLLPQSYNIFLNIDDPEVKVPSTYPPIKLLWTEYPLK